VTPKWKIRREISRLGQQLRALPEAIWEPGATRRHDARFPSQIVMTNGNVSVRPKMAMILIYPRPDLGETTVNLCAALHSEGIATLVVSNAPLSEPQRARLLPHVWTIAERPNLGHDFGGYRDGLRLLRHWKIDPDEMLILNDSVWLVDGDVGGLLAALRGLKADVAGSVLRGDAGSAFLESYCYLVQGHVLRDPRIQEYWDRMVLTSNKYKVIRRGERGHSAALQAAGFRLAACFDEAAFRNAVTRATSDDLALTLRHGAYLYKADHDAASELLNEPRTGEWRNRAEEMILKVLDRGQFYSLFPIVARNELSYPFLKRSGDRVSVFWRRAFLSAVEDMAVPDPDPAVLAELRAAVTKDAWHAKMFE